MIDNKGPFQSTTLEGGNTPPPTPSNPLATSVELHRFGEKFRLEARSAFGDLTCVMSAARVRELRDRCNHMLKEGREVRKNGRARK